MWRQNYQTIYYECGNVIDIKIEGYNQACPFFTYTYSAPIVNNGDYYWTVTNGTIISGQNTHQIQLKLNQNPSNQTNLMLTVSNVCTTPIYAYKTIIHGNPPPPEQQCYSHREESILVDKFITDNNQKLIVYPNPASFVVTVVPPDANNYKIYLYDIKGHILYETKESNNDKLYINTESFVDGIYYIKVIGEEKSFIEKLILKK